MSSRRHRRIVSRSGWILVSNFLSTLTATPISQTAICQAHTDHSDTISMRKATKKKRASTSTQSATDWKKLRAMKDSDIDLSEDPESTPAMFAKAIVRKGLKPLTKNS